MKKLCMALLLATALATSTSALEVPTGTVVQNLNGSQQVVKTYTLAPDTDPQSLIEEPFELEGYRYTFADIVKKENSVQESRTHTETVTVETEKNDLSIILEQLGPTMEYDDGFYYGVLALDHTSLQTEAAGYTTGSKTVSETKTIGPLDRNDMSYVPATTVKNGKTLSLANVDWQVIGTDMVGDVLAPSSYQAVATYTGKSTYSVATGYVTTAQYVGEISHEGVESITYQVTYLGTEAEKPALPSSEVDTDPLPSKATGGFTAVLPLVLGGAGLLAIAALAVLLARSNGELKQLRAEVEEAETNDSESEVEAT